MSFAQLPKMLTSETQGWSDIAERHPAANRLLFCLVMPMSLIPPLMYGYSELANPGQVFPLSVPALSGFQLWISCFVLFAVQVAMVSFVAMLIQRMATARDHDPGYEAAYSLAAIAPAPLWLSSLALFVPSLSFNVMVVAAAWVASVALIRHGVRPLLKVTDVQKSRYIANMVTLALAPYLIC